MTNRNLFILMFGAIFLMIVSIGCFAVIAIYEYLIMVYPAIFSGFMSCYMWWAILENINGSKN